MIKYVTMDVLCAILKCVQMFSRGMRWCSGRASDSEGRGPGFDPTHSTMLFPSARHI